MVSIIQQIQGRSQPNTAGGEGAKKISGGAKYLSSFLKFELKNRRKSAEEAKHNICSLLLLCYFSSNKIDLR